MRDIYADEPDVHPGDYDDVEVDTGADDSSGDDGGSDGDHIDEPTDD